ncbi:glycosyltransferase family 15 protein [Macrolepiota fuliginosa MF-IS2]|uniref:Glycosyltransferase family 15 protein n=1 Tax=Macrolepiota fuliginosa MF-IS2 TaxID=1400762 RepID=A0A9P5XN28_9AGAR|nr:glycosyltransferase family 15 protein [Macrolepiota fuliginosa MF-IS2]
MAGLSPFASGPRRFIFVILATVVMLHYVLGMLHSDYSRLTNFSSISEKWKLAHERVFNSSASLLPPPFLNDSLPVTTTEITTTTELVEVAAPEPTFVPPPPPKRANATFVFLCRNSDLAGVVSSIRQMEDRFNRNHGYPWVLLNEEPFTEEFKERVRVLTDAPIHFGQIPSEHWYQPDWIDEDRARAGRSRLMAQGIIYAGSVPYRNMCRFNSGFFFKHELLQPYRYYWRPGVQFFCDVTYDPFVFMQENNKVYSFTISLVEWEPTIPTLWSTVKEFVKRYPELLDPNNSLGFLSDNNGVGYNLCHFWSNFEIADMDFWRGEAYQKFFDFLESKGGFYYERWGDAPVHSIAASLFASKDQVHFFRDIGYRHDPFQHCPSGDDWTRGRCSCDPKDSFDYAPNSCLKRFEKLFG